METLEINGKNPLRGSVKASGAKNSITKILVASLLSEQKCHLCNVPDLAEVAITVELCQAVGSQVVWDKQGCTIDIWTPSIKSATIAQSFSGANRIPILLLGALLGRTSEKITIPTVGGCAIGKRPVDFHIAALQKLGAEISYQENMWIAHAPNGLKGNIITLPYPSVGATENTLLAATHAKGSTIIYNSAIEPEILDLISFLRKLGVTIFIESNRTIRVEGANRFYPVTHTVIPDRLEVASLAMAAISTKGSVFIESAEPTHLLPVLDALKQLGAGIEIDREGILFFYDKPLCGNLHIETGVYPGFATDWQQPFVVLLTQTEGSSSVHETVYEKRFEYTHMLKKMGANLLISTHCLSSSPCRFFNENHEHSVLVQGPTPLQGKEIVIPDLRAGFAYVMAALIADGTSVIHNAHLLKRGYDNLVTKLCALGADVRLREEVLA